MNLVDKDPSLLLHAVSKGAATRVNEELNPFTLNLINHDFPPYCLIYFMVINNKMSEDANGSESIPKIFNI